MRPKPPTVALCALLLVIVLGATLLSGPEAAARYVPLAASFTPTGKEAVAYALKRVSRTGSFNHPDYPWVVRARCVCGDTLFFVDFLHRREDSKGFDAVGKAVQVALAFSDEAEPIHWPFRPFEDEPVPPQRRDTLRVAVWGMEMQTEDGSIICMAQQTFDLTLPARLRSGGFRPFDEVVADLSEEQCKALDKEYQLDLEQKLLLLIACGEQGYDLLRSCLPEVGLKRRRGLISPAPTPNREERSEGR
jgi:hypothetical protein